MSRHGDDVLPLTTVRLLLRGWLDSQVLRFLISGGTCFAVEVATFAVTVALSDSLVLANTVAVATASALNYTLHVLWVFRTTARPRTTLTRYVLSLIISYALSTTGVVLVVALGVPDVAAKVFVTAGLAPLAFLSGRHWVYPGSAPVRPVAGPPN